MCVCRVCMTLISSSSAGAEGGGGHVCEDLVHASPGRPPPGVLPCCKGWDICQADMLPPCYLITNTCIMTSLLMLCSKGWDTYQADMLPHGAGAMPSIHFPNYTTDQLVPVLMKVCVCVCIRMDASCMCVLA